MGRRNDIDWEAIERDYRLGQFTARALGKQHGVNASSIVRKAEKQGWTRDLSAEVRTRTNAALLANATQSNTDSRAAHFKALDEAAIDAAVRTNVEVVRQHRRSLGRAHRITEAMLDQLERLNSDNDEIAAAVETDAALDARARKRALKAIDLPARAQTAQALSATLRNLIPLERQAFNLNEPGEGEAKDALAQLRKQISGTAFRPAE